LENLNSELNNISEELEMTRIQRDEALKENLILK